MPYSSNVSNRGKEFVELIRGVIPNESPKVAIRKITAVKENGKYDITDEGDNTSSGASDIINQSVYNFKVNDDALILFYGDYAKSPVIIGKVSPQSSDEKIFQMQNDIETLKRASNVGTVVKTEEITTSSGGTGTTYVSGDGIDISGNVISNTYNQVTGTADGTNWTKIKIGGVEKNIPTGGGGGSYTAGRGIIIDDNEISAYGDETTINVGDAGISIIRLPNSLLFDPNGENFKFDGGDADKIILSGNNITFSKSQSGDTLTISAANTTYTAGDGLQLNENEFSVFFGDGLKIDDNNAIAINPGPGISFIPVEKQLTLSLDGSHGLGFYENAAGIMLMENSGLEFQETYGNLKIKLKSSNSGLIIDETALTGGLTTNIGLGLTYGSYNDIKIKFNSDSGLKFAGETGDDGLAINLASKKGLEINSGLGIKLRTQDSRLAFDTTDGGLYCTLDPSVLYEGGNGILINNNIISVKANFGLGFDPYGNLGIITGDAIMVTDDGISVAINALQGIGYDDDIYKSLKIKLKADNPRLAFDGNGGLYCTLEPGTASHVEHPLYFYAKTWNTRDLTKRPFDGSSSLKIKPRTQKLNATQTGNIIELIDEVDSQGVLTDSILIGLNVHKLETRLYYEGFITCLMEGTKILMADGTEKPIENIAPGDMIMSYNPVTQEKIESMVLYLDFTGYSQNFEFFLFDDGNYLEIYQHHPIWNDHEGYLVNSKRWNVGDIARSSSLNQSTLANVKSTYYGIPKSHYTLITSNNLYFANNILCGHNDADKYTIINKRNEELNIPDSILATWKASSEAEDVMINHPIPEEELVSSAEFLKERNLALAQQKNMQNELDQGDHEDFKAMEAVLRSIQSIDTTSNEAIISGFKDVIALTQKYDFIRRDELRSSLKAKRAEAKEWRDKYVDNRTHIKNMYKDRSTYFVDTVLAGNAQLAELKEWFATYRQSN